MQCPRCEKSFANSYLLKKHQERKTPCGSIVKLQCSHCLTEFSHRSSLDRHIKDRCKQINRLAPTTRVIKNTNITTNISTTINVINVIGYNPRHPIRITPEMIRHVFATNPIAADFLKLSEVQQGSAEIGQKYIPHIATALIAQAHALPENQNIWINRANTTQVLTIDDNGAIATHTLVSKINELNLGLKAELRCVNYNNELRQSLGSSALEGAIGIIPTQIDYDEKFDERIKPEMRAHLHNIAVARDETLKLRN